MARLRTAHFANKTQQHVLEVRPGKQGRKKNDATYLHVPQQPAVSTKNRSQQEHELLEEVVNGTPLVETGLKALRADQQAELDEQIDALTRDHPFGEIINATRLTVEFYYIEAVSTQTGIPHLFGRSNYDQEETPFQLMCAFAYTAYKVLGLTLEEGMCLDINLRPGNLQHLMSHPTMVVLLTRVTTPELLTLFPEAVPGKSWEWIKELTPNPDVLDFLDAMRSKHDGQSVDRTKLMELSRARKTETSHTKKHTAKKATAPVASTTADHPRSTPRPARTKTLVPIPMDALAAKKRAEQHEPDPEFYRWYEVVAQRAIEEEQWIS